MADLNDLTQNVNIWDDAKSKSVDVITDEEGKERLAVDANIQFVEGSVITMEHWLRKLYDGYVFHVSKLQTEQLNDVVYVLFKVPSGYNAFIRWLMSCELGLYFHIFESPTVSANGTAMSIHNLNRQSANAAQTDVYYQPTVTADGTELEVQLLPGSNQSGGGGASDISFVLKENTDYLMKFTSLGNGNDIAFEFNWFEEDYP